LQNSKLPLEPPFSAPLSQPLPLRAALPWLASERDRDESDRSLGYSARDQTSHLNQKFDCATLMVAEKE
jgi:hypothetical protein